MKVGDEMNPSCSGAEQSFSSRPVSFVSLESEDCSTPGEDPHSSPTAGERHLSYQKKNVEEYAFWKDSQSSTILQLQAVQRR